MKVFIVYEFIADMWTIDSIRGVFSTCEKACKFRDKQINIEGIDVLEYTVDELCDKMVISEE